MPRGLKSRDSSVVDSPLIICDVLMIVDCSFDGKYLGRKRALVFRTKSFGTEGKRQFPRMSTFAFYPLHKMLQKVIERIFLQQLGVRIVVGSWMRLMVREEVTRRVEIHIHDIDD